MRSARLGVAACALFLCFVAGLAQVSRQQVDALSGVRPPSSPQGREVLWRAGSEELAAAVPIFGSIATVASGSPAAPQQIFGHRQDVFLAGGPVSTPCRFAEYLPDGKYYFQVTDPSGNQLLSTDPVSERAVTVKAGVIASYDGATHAADGKTACGSLAVNLMPFADAGSQKAAYVAWLTPAADFDGSVAAVDSVCGAGCFHGFHSDLSRTFAFRVEDKKSCEPTFCVSGVKFLDANGNGTRDSGEAGLAGVEIRVANESGVLLSGLTGPDGSFRICGLTVSGAFKVSEKVPFGYTQTGPVDRDISRHVFARGGAFIIEVCQEDIAGLDFGNKLIPNAIGGLKFEDLNANGARDPGEPGLAGVTILLTPAAGGTARTTVTDASGNFLFTDVAPGSYVLNEVMPAGFTQTMPASDGIPVTLASGGSSINNVFGNFHGILTGTISGVKFNDLNGNGARDPGEPGIGGVLISVFACRSPCFQPPFAGTTTAADGSFLLTGIPLGVTFWVSEAVPPGFQKTTPAEADIPVLLDFGHQAVSGLLFGNRAQAAATASVSGTKFLDTNGNGVRDPGEAGQSGVTIQLKPSSGPTLTATTDASGAFSFTGLAAGTYVLSEVVPAGFVQTAPPAPGTISVTLTAGQNATGFLFGNQAVAGPTGSISGLKILDLDVNGIFDGIDRPLEGIVFVLTDASGVIHEATSGADGTFSFTNLPAGTYVLSEILPANFFQTFPGTPDSPGTYTITLAPGQNATGFLFLNKC